MNFLKRAKEYLFGGQDPAASSSSGGQQQADGQRHGADAAAAARAEPVLREAGYAADGGVQGLSWYVARLQHDQHGDVATQFISEDDCCACLHSGQDSSTAVGSSGPHSAVGAGAAPMGAMAWPPPPAQQRSGQEAQQQQQQHGAQPQPQRPLKVQKVEMGSIVLSR